MGCSRFSTVPADNSYSPCIVLHSCRAGMCSLSLMLLFSTIGFVVLQLSPIVVAQSKAVQGNESILYKNITHGVSIQRIPAFIIIGAQKCGTTSMYDYLCQHPLVVRGKTNEAHFFDRAYNHSINDAENHRHYSGYFQLDQLNKNDSLITGESSPVYILHSHTIPARMKRVCPWAKLIVMLRNPTDRAYSQYQMIMDPLVSNGKLLQASHYNRTFDAIIREEIKFLRKNGISPKVSEKVWREKVLNHLPTLHGRHSIVARGLYVLQLRTWMAHWPAKQVQIHTMKELQGLTRLQGTMQKVFDYLHLPPYALTDVEAKNTRKYKPMSAESRALLDTFYASYNTALFELLGTKELEW